MAKPWVNSQEVGGRWVHQSPFESLEAITAANRFPRVHTNSLRSFGYESWFCDFNNPMDFSISQSSVNAAVSGSFPASQSVPSPTDLALLTKLDADGGVGDTNYASTITTDPTSPNLNTLAMWRRVNIGSPTTMHFWSPKALGSTGQNDRESSVRIGVNDINTGFSARQTLFTLNGSGASYASEWGFITRIKDVSSAPLNMSFFGFSEFANEPLTTAGAYSNTCASRGFYIDSDGLIYSALSDLGSEFSQVSTGKSMATDSNYVILEIRAFTQTSAGYWNNGFINFYVNGELVRQALASQFSNVYDIGSTPMAITMANVNVAGGTTVGSVDVDYIGAMRSRSTQVSPG